MTAVDPIVVEVGSAPITVTVASTGLVLSVATGTVGPAGATGPAGTNGQGVPVGGTTGQVLAKASGTNYDTEWVAQTGGGGGGSGTVTEVSGTAPISVATGTTTPVVSIAAASTSAAGSMSAADKSKLDGVAAGATANATDAQLRDRSTHTGTQTLSTISDAGTAAAKNVPAAGNASATEVVYGTDTRLTDARTPSTHASSHGSAGSDPLTLSQSQVTNLTTDLAGKVPTTRTVNGQALSGDITITATLADGDVTTAKIADSAVTSAKIADGTIVNADVSASAAIAATKISGLAAIAASGSGSDITTGTVAVARLGSTAPPVPFPYASNDWVPLWVGGGSSASNGVGGTATASNNLVRFMPLWIGQSASLVGLGIDVAAANAGASAVVRLGLFADSSGRPGSVVVDAGTASLNTAVAKELTFSSVALSPGWYWVAIASQNLDTSGTNPTYRSSNAPPAQGTRTSVPSATASQGSQFTASSVSGAFAASPTVTVSTTFTSFFVWGKFA